MFEAYIEDGENLASTCGKTIRRRSKFRPGYSR